MKPHVKNIRAESDSFAVLTLLTLLAYLVLLVSGGCGGNLPVASHLERTRVLGARVTVAGEPGRADVQAGRRPSSNGWSPSPTPQGQLECGRQSR